jgi:hypothetical protein
MHKDVKIGRFGNKFDCNRAELMTLMGDVDGGIELVRNSYEKYGGVYNGGFYKLGWVYGLKKLRDVQVVRRFFYMDQEVYGESTAPSNLFEVYRSSLLAYEGYLEEALAILQRLYSEGGFVDVGYIRVGLLHWLAHRDDCVLQKMILKEYEQGLPTIWQSALLLKLGRSRKLVDEKIIKALESDIGRDLNYALGFLIGALGNIGFNTENIAELLSDEFISYTCVVDRRGLWERENG